MTRLVKKPLRQELRELPTELWTARIGWRRVMLWGVILGVLFVVAMYGMQIVLPNHIDPVNSWNLG